MLDTTDHRAAPTLAVNPFHLLCIDHKHDCSTAIIPDSIRISHG